MAELKSFFAVDPKVRDEGVWMALPGEAGSIHKAKVRLRSEDYGPYKQAIGDAVTRHQGGGRYTRRQQSQQTLAGLNLNEFERERGALIAEFLLLDWDLGALTENDQPIPYSKETAKRFLTDPDWYDFYCAIGELLDQLTSRKSEWEEDRKKSSSSASS